VGLKTIAKATLQHAVACDFTQIRAAQAPQGACNRVLLNQRLPSSAMQDVSEMRQLRHKWFANSTEKHSEDTAQQPVENEGVVR
jgi:hypothetical protein